MAPLSSSTPFTPAHRCCSAGGGCRMGQCWASAGVGSAWAGARVGSPPARRLQVALVAPHRTEQRAGLVGQHAAGRQLHLERAGGVAAHHLPRAVPIGIHCYNLQPGNQEEGGSARGWEGRSPPPAWRWGGGVASILLPGRVQEWGVRARMITSARPHTSSGSEGTRPALPLPLTVIRPSVRSSATAFSSWGSSAPSPVCAHASCMGPAGMSAMGGCGVSCPSQQQRGCKGTSHFPHKLRNWGG